MNNGTGSALVAVGLVLLLTALPIDGMARVEAPPEVAEPARSGAPPSSVARGLGSVGGALVGRGDLGAGVHALEQAPVGPDASCEELYDRASALETYTRRERPEFFDNPVNGVLSAIGTVWPQAYLLMLVPALASSAEADVNADAHEMLRDMRSRLAARHCFVR